MSNLVYDCVSCVAKEKGASGSVAVAALITGLKTNMTLTKVYDGLCPEHKRLVDDSINEMEN